MSFRSLALALLLTASTGCASSPRATAGATAADPWAGIPLPPDTLSQTALASYLEAASAVAPAASLRIGADDLLQITVLEAPELDRSARVTGEGTISVPLLGEVRAGGLTPRELELELEAAFRKTFILDPHVTVEVSEIQSRPVSVVGAVVRPGVFQIRGSRTLLEVLALAGGLSEEAGDVAIILRPGAPTETGGALVPEVVEVPLRDLLAASDGRYNVPIYSGDVVKVQPAGLIYVVGEVNRPGAFPLQRGSGLTVLQAIALGSGLRPLAAGDRTIIIRTTPEGHRTEMEVDVGAVLAGRIADPPLQPRDVLFVPNNDVKAAALSVVDALVRMVTLRGLF